MSQQPESRLVGRMINFLKANYPGYWKKIHGGPFQGRGIPDILGCYNGYFISIEAKMKGNKVSPIQESNGKAIKKAKGIWLVAYSVNDIKLMMEDEFE